MDGFVATALYFGIIYWASSFIGLDRFWWLVIVVATMHINFVRKDMAEERERRRIIKQKFQPPMAGGQSSS